MYIDIGYSVRIVCRDFVVMLGDDGDIGAVGPDLRDDDVLMKWNCY